MNTRFGLVLIIALTLVGGSVALAQEQGDATTTTTVINGQSIDLTANAGCPEGLVCVDYEGALLELDPSCGPVISVIVSESLARTIDLAGIRESTGVTGVVVVADGDRYEVAGTFTEPAVGALAGTSFGDVGCLDFGAMTNG